MDFIDKLKDKVNEIPNLPVKCKIGFLDAGESFVVYPLPGGREVTRYMDGTSDQQLNFEFAMQSKSQSKVHNTLWEVQNVLARLTELESDRFILNDLIITNKPFINQLDEQGWFIFLLDIQANITVFKGE